MDIEKKSNLLREYQICHSGYIARDTLIPQEFSFMLQAFVVFITLIAAARALIDFDEGLAALAVSLLGLAGFLTLIAFLIDIEANTSSKRALARRCEEIEEILDGELSYWSTIYSRDMYLEEALLKRPIGSVRKRSGAAVFVLVARLLVLFWLALTAIVALWGQSLDLHG